MDLSLNETQEMLRTAAHDFVEHECPSKVALQLDKSETGFSRDMWRKMGELGWLGMILPEEYGGMNSSLTDLAVVFQELGWGAVPGPFLSSAVICGLVVLQGGSEQQKKELLPSVSSGKEIMTLALTEPDCQWSPESVQLTAKARDGKYILNGTKLFIPDAHIADRIICVARTRQSRNPEQGITLFLVDKNAPGLSCRNLEGFVGEKESELTFDSVEVDSSAIIGQPNKGWTIIKSVTEKASPILCAYKVGGCQRVWELTVDYCRTRVQFGSSIGTFQRVQDHVIEILNAMDAAKWTTYEALWKLDSGKEDAAKSVILAKIVSSEGFHKACTHAHEVHAGVGVDRNYPLHLYTKKSRSLLHYLGSPIYLRKQMEHLLCDG